MNKSNLTNARSQKRSITKMFMKTPLLTYLVLSMSICHADANQVRQLLELILGDSSYKEVPKRQEFDLKLHDAAQYLTATDYRSLLPVAWQCLQSSRDEASAAGIDLFLYAGLTLDGSKLIEPYMDDFERVLSGPANPSRYAVVLIIAMANPSISRRAIQMLSAHLEDKTNSLEEREGIASALINASPADQAMIHRVISFTEKQSEDKLTGEVIRVLGLIRTRNAEALEYIPKGFDNSNRFVRESALNSASRMDRDVRAKFAAQLGRIANDPDEQPELRSRAAEAISK